MGPAAASTADPARTGRRAQAHSSAIALLRGLGNLAYEAEGWESLGYVEHRSGDHVAAAASYERALGLHQEFGDRFSQATALDKLGDALHAAGQTEPARGAWHDAAGLLDALHHPDAGRVRAKLRQTGPEGAPS